MSIVGKDGLAALRATYQVALKHLDQYAKDLEHSSTEAEAMMAITRFGATAGWLSDFYAQMVVSLLDEFYPGRAANTEATLRQLDVSERVYKTLINEAMSRPESVKLIKRHAPELLEPAPPEAPKPNSTGSKSSN
jgi:hypothetical protein